MENGFVTGFSPEARGLASVALELELASRALFRGAPLYSTLSREAARDPFLLSLAACARPGQSPVLMLLASVHYLILRGSTHPLAALYADLGAGRLPADPFPLFRSFCMEHAETLREIIASRRVQTNEVGRSVYIRLGLEWIGLTRETGPLSLVEIGASAGLNLGWDGYGVEFVRAGTPLLLAGDPESAVRLCCEVVDGSLPGERGARPPEIAERLGLELDPPNLDSHDDMLWLAAFLWADHPDRLTRFQVAVGLARNARWPVVAGDASRDLVRWCTGLRSDTLLCIVHTYLMTQLTPEVRRGLEDQLARLSEQREIVQIAVEQPAFEAQLELATWKAGQVERVETLAVGDPHGRRISWNAP